MKYIKKSLKQISWKDSILVLIDMASYLLIFLVSYLFGILVEKRMHSIDLPDNLLQLTESQIASLGSLMQSSYTYILSLVIGSLLFMVLIWSISRPLLWNLSAKKKINKKFLRKLWIFPVWYGFGLIISLAIFTIFKETINFYIFLIFIVAFNFYSIVLLRNYTNNQINLKNHSKCIFPYTITILLLLIISQLLNITIASFDIGLIISIILLLIYAVWTRYYILQKRG